MFKKESNKDTFGKIIKDARISKGYSARELAKLCDISHTEINNIEKGDRVRPAILTLKAFEKYLDLDFKKLARMVGYSEDLVEHSDNNIIVTYERYYKKVQDFEYAKKIILYEVDKRRHIGIDLQDYIDDLEKHLKKNNNLDETSKKIFKNINELLGYLKLEYDPTIEEHILKDEPIKKDN